MKAYLYSADKAVSVNGEEYKKVDSFWNSKKSYKVASEYGVYRFLDLTEDGFKKGEVNTVTIRAEGYEDLVLNLELLEDGTVAETKNDKVPDKNEGLNKGETPDEDQNQSNSENSGNDEILGDADDTPKVDSVKYDTSAFFYSAYRVEFSGKKTDEQGELSKYLTHENSEDMKVTINGIVYSKEYSLWGAAKAYKDSQDEYGETKYLDFTTDGFAAGENTIIIEVSGYKTIAIKFHISESNKVERGSGRRGGDYPDCRSLGKRRRRGRSRGSSRN
jgi:hypothetical protein